ncbi:MAG: thiamine pyrophosphate-dependent enzyme [Planctomycetes bacterium]|jgi:2-oxoglutarate ferredoxin oxidoreductase subunit beta|nr:thiamine pyrophosphate-dependent enzyme [Planctomycetota bacterium]
MPPDDRSKWNTEGKPTWCPGCGNFGIQAALKKALGSLGLEPHQVLLSSGIGCSGKIPHWVRVNGLHGLHGRALPAAAGMKLANRDATVIAEGGDGDGYSEGLSHFLHACRRNQDLTYIVHDNGVFGLTTGQVSPTGDRGFVSPTTPDGAVEEPFSPVALAVAAGASFAARGFSGDLDHLADLIAQAVRHRGFAFVDVLQVCVSFNPSKSYKWYQERIVRIGPPGHDPTDRLRALDLALRADGRIPIGVFYRAERPATEDSNPSPAGSPSAGRGLSAIDVSPLIEEMF